MNVPLEVLIGYGGTAVTVIGGWFAMRFGLDRANEKIKDFKEDADKKHIEYQRQIDALWGWKDEHDKEAAEIREKLNASISELKGANLVHTEQFKQVLAMLQDIKDRLEEFEKRLP